MKAKQVNTCSYDFETATRVDIIVLKCCHLDRGRLYERSGIKIIALCALEVKIINVQVFTYQPGLVYSVLHIKQPILLVYSS